MTGAERPTFIAIDSQALYWADFPGDELNVVPKQGGANVVLATGQDIDSQLVLDGTHIYWVSHDDVRRIAIGGGAVETVADNAGAWAVAVDGTHVYWSSFSLGDGSAIWRLPK